MKKKIKFFIAFTIFISLISCDSDRKIKEKSNNEIKKKHVLTNNIKFVDKKKIDTINLNLIDLKSIDSSIQIDLKYASEDNFMKQRLYFHTEKLLIQKDVALRLSKVQKYLKQINHNYSLLVYDGARPLSVQQKMWKALDSIPIKQRVKFVSNPANGSIHNYGAAVDLTICDQHKIPLDMGASYDEIREIAYPKNEFFYLKNGQLTESHIQNRKLLRKIMKYQGFENIPTEWWHFNACSRTEAKKKYNLIK